MKRILLASLVVIIAASVAGCGLKGPLYFPKKQKSPQPNTSNVDVTDVKAGKTTPLP